MKDIRVPGVVWAIAMVAIVAVLHENQDTWHITPLYADLVVVVVVGILKGMNLGTGQLDQALNIIENIRSNVAVPRTRGVGLSPEVPVVDTLAVEAMTASAPERPNKTVRWLVG